MSETASRLDALTAITDWYQTFDMPGFAVKGLANSPQKWAMLRQASGTFAGKTVLDIGSNQGYYSFRCAMEGALTTGIDFDPVAVATARRLKEFAFPEVKSTFKVGYVHDLPNEPMRDITICFSLLHHVPLLQTIKDIAAITRETAYIEALVDTALPNDRPLFSLSDNPIVKEVLANPTAFEAVLKRHFRAVRILNPGSDRLMARCDK